MNRIYISIATFCLFSVNVFSQSQWPSVTSTSKPWTRWWWMGSAVDAKNISIALDQYSNAGIGGVEIVPIYGAKGYENRYLSYLSPQWLQVLDSSIAIAKEKGMGVDMAVGTGWPIGGQQVSTTDAASKLQIQQYKLNAGQSLTERVVISDPKQQNIAGVTLQALIAYSSKGEITDLTSKVSENGTLDWVAPSEEWNLYAAFNAKTLQKVKRAAPGGEGLTFDHFSTTALGNYFKKYDLAYARKIPAVRSYFNDSYEVFNANWSPLFFDEFKKRRGYDLKLFLREFALDNNTDTVRRLKSDYRQTMADLMLENFSNKFSSWAHSKNALSTNQAHGSPGNLLDLYAAVDIAETETFGSTAFDIPGLRRNKEDIRNVDPDPVMSKFASSAANIIGHQLISCETFTWLTEHFKTAWSQCKPEVENVFLSGVNHVFFHGTTYSPADAAWPGWLFYASVNFVPNNSMWPHLKGLSDYITRCQSILQSGKPDNDILLYWPVYDAWNNAKGTDMPLKVHGIDEWLHPTSFYKNVKLLQTNGYNMDFVSDKMIEQAYFGNDGLQVTDSGASYKTVLVPSLGLMPVNTIQKLIALANAGATIIFESLPADVPGLKDHAQRKNDLLQLIAALPFKQTSNDYREAITGKGKMIIAKNTLLALQKENIKGEEMHHAGLQFIRRKVDNDYWYYIVNHTSRLVDTTIALERRAEFYYFLDAQTGKEGSVSVMKINDRPGIRVQLRSGETVFVKVSNKPPSDATSWKYNIDTKNTIALKNKWKVRFTSGGPQLPAARTITSLSSWTQWNDTTLQNFSGTAEYSSSFNLTNKKAKQYVLQLGKVNQSARVWINGKDAGYVWHIPFSADITGLIKKGRNDIKVEVVNLMANRIRYMDKNNIPWRNYHEINFVNIDYKPFSAVDWAVEESGLIGPVILKY